MNILISDATIVNEDRTFRGSIVIENDRISEIIENKEAPRGSYDNVVDATGCFVLPGIIDSHVHFREPGLTEKADIESESRTAAFGGVTTFFDMPNTIPQTTTLEALEDKYQRAAEESHVNYAFFFGATSDNADVFRLLDKHRVPGVKLFMGSSTGNMLVDRKDALERIFSTTELPIVAHCEDTAEINRNMVAAREKYGDDPDIHYHELIRSAKACRQSTELAVSLARKFGTRLHVAHLSTAAELDLFRAEEPNVTAEAVIAHLFFCNRDYDKLGALIKCNPSIKSAEDRKVLREALINGKITTVGTDHAPHRMEEKQGGCVRAMSGMPMLQFSLVAMLELVDEGVLPIERVARLMCHNPAELFDVCGRGFIRKGYKADLVVVKPDTPWTVTEDVIQSKCRWSPMTGHTFRWQVQHTFCNGHHIYNSSKGVFDMKSRGEAVRFREQPDLTTAQLKPIST